MSENVYICIDLKSFYASVESVERGLDPMTTNLVVADETRGTGAICLAITPAMKALGIKNRCRLFEIPQTIQYICAMPRMSLYMKYSAKIYSIYLKYVSKDDIHVYSIDEVFMDVTQYLKLYDKTPKEFAKLLMDAVYDETGICATSGIGTNLFLAKVAMDVTAKHVPDHMGYLDEKLFKEQMWHHRPITDIWNVGRGIAERLRRYGIMDLYGVAHADEQLLYDEFGVNAEFLIDHAWGREPCTIAEIHAYKSKSASLSNSQILHEDYSYEDAKVIVKEMLDFLVLELIERNLVVSAIAIGIGYSKDAHASTGGSYTLGYYTNSYKKLLPEFMKLYEKTTVKNCPIRRVGLALERLEDDSMLTIDLFTDVEHERREIDAQKTILDIKSKFGKNAILRGTDLGKKATARERNRLIGGHNSGEKQD